MKSKPKTKSKTKTETVETRHGTVQYEIVECDSCGMEVREEDTVPFSIGDTEGVACEDCERDGPISFPRRVLDASQPTETIDGQENSPFFHILFAPLLMWVLILQGLANDGDTFSDGYLTALLVFLVWGGTFGLGVYLL